ncbi:FRAS1-related extracellular matrix protein 2-like isoform X2 [Ruditapes philippinarum]|uniref:FRAS1-related extracellular matrix protein 2-like isoform X2 n=1 Tax=Ruditapes philippinarum TaxID=129788 RepID=UPI00295B0BA2|nr:FRAS1-related extracellular matrix protein 2-like isoform X2 [Ruditapes philippinarum]
MELNWVTFAHLTFCLYLIVLCNGAKVNLGETDILIVNRPVSVSFGRSVTINPLTDLRINVRPGDTCVVTSLDRKWDLTFKPGTLSASEFPCNFGTSGLKYTHFGSRRLSTDVIQLLLRYDSATQTIIIPFSLVININFKPLEIITHMNTISVIRHLGLSTPIDSRTLKFTVQSKEETVCKLSVISRSSGLPQYGYLSNSSLPLTNMDCNEFLNLGIRYKHHAQVSAPNIDFIPMTVQLLRKNGDLLKQEYFQVKVEIVSGQENTAPEPSRDALFIMDSINQFVMTAITPEIISAYDAQTPSDKLLFNITQYLGPGEGIIVNTDNRNIPIHSFYQHEINDLKIAYKPPSSDSNIKRLFQTEITIYDTDGLASDPIPLMIVVAPMNTYAPVVTTNTGIQLTEGETRAIKSPNSLEISDEDDLDDVKIYHIDGMKHGHLVLPPGKKYFTPSDLEQGSVVYHHDDSESLSDNIIFRMSDGSNEVEFLFPVTIFPKDDLPPTLNVNTGLELRKGDVVEISQFILSATDTDTADESIIYNIKAPYSIMGVINKRQFQMPNDVEKWDYENGIYAKVVTNFTQKDIVEGKIFYNHVGDHISDIVTDKIRISLSDSGNPPNISPEYELIVKIHPVDNIPPYLYPNTQLQLEVEENEMVHFRRKTLRYADDDTNDREIKYQITRPPYDTYTGGPGDAGKIVYCEDPYRAIIRFVQSEINHYKICFQPPSVELGLTTRIIQFDFSVEDTSGNVLRNQQCKIIIKPINNQPPIIKNTGVVIFENDEILITSEMFDIEDRDTDLTDIIIIVRVVPDHGGLYKEGRELSVGDVFKMSDIIQRHIMYKNYGESVEVFEDKFVLEVTDGVHFIPGTFKIKIRPIDDEPAYFEGTADSSTLNIQLDVNEKQSVTIQQDQFKIRDPDSDVMNVMYLINKYPQHGSILKNGRRVSYFSQRDIWRGTVTYQHSGDEIGLNETLDQVQLGVHDNNRIVLEDGTRLKDIYIYIKIFPVNDVAPVITTGENLNVLEGGKVTILPTNFDIQDSDTREDEIICMINEQAKHGFLENKAPQPGSEKSREGLPISAFSVKSLRQGDISYVQSVHKGVEPREDQIKLQCSDGINLSNSNKLHIVIHPANDEVPEVYIREFIGSEGMEIRIDSPILNAVDKDEPPDTLNFIITKQPTHGKIFQQTMSGDLLVNNFTLGDIEKFSTIIYEHDDSETESDHFEFVLTDGVHNISKSVPIIIFPVDDETPRLKINNGIEIENLGDRKVITNKDLLAEDIDSYIGNITYIIRRTPQQGYLQKRFRNYERNLTLGLNFTQMDIDRQVITYIHTGQEVKRDVIKFEVTDGLNPLIDRNFYITIQGMDIIYPEVFNRGVELPEGGMVVLTTDIISVTDIDTPDEKLRYTVTKPPQHGMLEYVVRPGIPILTFSQLDLVASRVRYVHNAEDEMKMDNFEFEVTDGFNPVSRSFRIALTDVDNKRPVLMFTMLRLTEGSNKTITPYELKAVDLDTPDEKIIFTITQVPLHGNLLYNFSRIVSRFSLKDIHEKQISYQHDGTETLSDSFTFTVTDGTHVQFYIPGSNIPTRRPQEMDIEIIPVDNRVPQMSVNTGATFLTPLDVGLGFQFTSRCLQSEDYDSPDDSLKYTVTVPPKHGYIRNIRRGNGGMVMWNQGDIKRQEIQYILNPGENASSDSFFFKVSDEGGNSLKNQPFHLNWGWISFKHARQTVNETQGTLLVMLQRRGFLAETSFVTINVTERTASIGKDVSRQYSEQVQFNPGETVKPWSLRLRNDDIYEREETLILQMTDPVSAVLEYPDVAMITIVDPEDESTVFFPEVLYSVEEKTSKLEIPIFRTGDLSDEFMVICYTAEGTARGTPPNKVQSYSDYISRPKDHNSMIRFDKGEDKKMCTVTIIDDTLFEEEERFSLVLVQPMGGKIGNKRETVIVIGQDPVDEPKFYFDREHYHVDEGVGTFEVKVWKTGTDLSRPSSVTVRSRKTEPMSAEASTDYIPVVRILDFAPGEMTETLSVTILDDLGHPVLEGSEKFELHLRMPVGGSIGEPSVAIITINDSLSDLPKMEFADVEYEVLEREEEVVAKVTRSGDISQESYVRCYTRQASAQVDVDYIERPDTNSSFVFFKPGEGETECRVKIINDRHNEKEESFRLVLGTPGGAMPGGATLGGQITTKIVIHDPDDIAVIKFDKSQYTVNEPIIPGDVNVLRVPVIRLGDTSGTSEVRVSTKSGSASAGRDFNGHSILLRFEPGIEQLFAEIEINYDGETENSESFSLHLSQDRNMIAEVHHNSKATVYIEENSKFINVVFPVPPLVVSLRDLDQVGRAMNMKPINGYPLVCVSPCNPKHPKYKEVKQKCSEIDNKLTKFRWRVGPPEDENGVFGNMRDLETDTAFTSTRGITLDSIYFTRGSQVRCFARAVNEAGEPGREIGSPVVTVDTEEGKCLPRTRGAVGADPFTARLWYTGTDDKDQPNTVRLTVQVPHTDGMFPVISTRRLSNFQYALSKDAYRMEHPCSNLLDIDKRSTKYGFITNGTRKSKYITDSELYELDENYRPQSTLRFYKNLDLDSCVWTFESYYDMSELVDPCQAMIQAEAQVQDIRHSYVSLKLPLFVSYVYFSPELSYRWRHFDLNTELNLKFVYNTAILWQEGISTIQEETDIEAHLYPTSMRIKDDGKLVVGFKTVANFRGQFILFQSGADMSSSVKLPGQPDIALTLRLVRSDSTYDQPEQLWEFVSSKAIQDFSGDYKVSLIPCFATLTQKYSLPLKCTPRTPMTFDLPIRFQQVSDPVATEFSLNTEFYLVRKKDVWLSDNIQGLGLREEDTAFAPGDTIYGRVNVDTVQSLGNQFVLNIEKVFLCSGKDGYIPRYDPDNGEYGCVGESKNLDTTYRIVDAEAPYTVDTDIKGVPFNAMPAKEDSKAVKLVLQSGADGFSFDSKPLFQVDAGKQWFLHSIYSIRSRSSKSKRDVHEVKVHNMLKRSQTDLSDIGNGEKGTNMAPLILNLNGKSISDDTYKSDKIQESEEGQTPLIAVLIGVGILLLIAIFILVIFIRHRRKRTSPPPTPSGTITVMSTSPGHTRVISNAHIFKKNDLSEV